MSKRPQGYTPIATGQEAIDRNLRSIQEALARLAQDASAVASAASYVFVGSASSGVASEVFQIPDGAVRLHFSFAMLEDFNTAAITLNSSGGTYFQKLVGAARSTSGSWFLAGGGTFGSPSFTDGDIGLGTTKIPTAFFNTRTHDDDGTADDIVYSGGTALTGVATTLSLACPVGTYAFNLWAELAA